MSFKTTEDVLYHALKDLLSAEKQFKSAMPKLAEAAEDSALAEAYREHTTETEGQIARLEKCFKLLGKAERSEKCEAADGLTEEGEEVIEEGGEGPAFDVMLAAAGRKSEHYEIASYEDAIACAEALGQQEMAALLKQTLEEEKAAALKLQQIAAQLLKAAPVA